MTTTTATHQFGTNSHVYTAGYGFRLQSSPRPAPPVGATVIKWERGRSDINTDQLGEYLHGKVYLARQKRLLDIITKEKIFDKSFNKQIYPDQSRGARVLLEGRDYASYKTSMAGTRKTSRSWPSTWSTTQPYHLHISLFTAAMREQTSGPTAAYWMPKIASWEVIGAYAQTELGHGSNVRGIETGSAMGSGKRRTSSSTVRI